MKLLALDLTDKAAREALRARLSLVLPEERLRDLMPEAPNAPVMGLPEFSEVFPGVAPRPVTPAARHPLDPVPVPGLGGASNAFAAAGSRTGSGASLLATDPHLGLTAPSIWMLARMDLVEGPVMGGDGPRHSRGADRPQRRSRLGPDRELSRRPGHLSSRSSTRRMRTNT